MTDREEVWIVDRFESGYAVVERALHETLNVPRAVLPAGIQEGDALRLTFTGDGEKARVVIASDPAETARRKRETRRILGNLKKRSPGDRIDL